MEHDKDAIRNARQAGAIGGLDALALELDEREKGSLLRKIQPAATAAPAGGAEPRGENIFERLRRKSSPAARDDGKPSLFSKVVEFFKSLFAGVSKENLARRRALRETEQALLGFSIAAYDPKVRAVRRDLIEVLAQLSDKINRFADFFNANFVISADDLFQRRYPCFARFIIENSLGLEQAKMLRELLEMDLPHAFQLRGEADTRKDVELLLKKFTDSFTAVNNARIEEQLAFFMSILNLKNYNFHGLLTLFIQEGSRPEAPVYRDFAVEHCLGQLKNLASFFAAINFERLREEDYQWFDRFQSEAVERIRISGEMPSRAPREGAGQEDADLPEYGAADFRHLIGPLRKIIEKQVVIHLVRIGEEDPVFRPKPVINSISYVEKFRNLVERAVIEHMEKEIVRLREAQVAVEVGELFRGSRQPEMLPACALEVNERLHRAGSRGFESGFIFSLLYNYMDKIYVEKFRKSVNAIVVEGEFRKKEMASEFSNNYYGIDELYSRMQTLAGELGEGAGITIKINSFLEGKLDNPIAKKKFESDLETLDESMDQVAKALGTALMKMFKHMDVILRDFKGLRVIDLLNAKTIGGVANRSLLFAYDKLVMGLRQLEAILGRFMVIREIE